MDSESPKECKTFLINDKRDLDFFYRVMNDRLKSGGKGFNVEVDSKRTKKQNSSLHLYCRNLAIALNEAGYQVCDVLTKKLEMSWSDHLIKELLWRKIQEALFDIPSTTRLTTSQTTQVYDELNKIISGRFGIYVPWPSQESQSEEARKKEEAQLLKATR